MCGFAGYISFTDKRYNNDLLIAMGNVISHRGPDDFGIEKFSFDNYELGMSFRRLSIIELSELGHQPMFSNDKNICVVFNGEIYNYREIRVELEKHGYTFKTNSDTEVIIAAYLKWGIEAVNRFIGMFAIALFDKSKHKFFLIRDRAGVKPLYWFMNKDVLIFGSELKSFHEHPAFPKKINTSALAEYFMYGYINTPHTIFENTFKVNPGTYLELNILEHKALFDIKYWCIDNIANDNVAKISYNEAILETEKILTSACNYRMVADVPVGMFLSGGYDSSAVAALLQANSTNKLKTFTIGFEDDKFNEASYAKKVADYLGTDHHQYICTQKEAQEIIPNLAFIYDEPFGDSSAIPTYLVSKVARNYVTVALSADGGDEQFAGYPRYIKALNYYNKFSKLSGFSKKALASIASLLPEQSNVLKFDNKNKLIEVLKSENYIWNYALTSHALTFQQAKSLINHNITLLDNNYNQNNFSASTHFLTQVLATDYKTYLTDDILTKVDRATMAVSLEGREPLLDHRIAELVFKLPNDYKFYNGIQKRILKDIVHKYIPKEIMERPKMGFGVPITDWLKTDLKDLLLDVLNTDKIKLQGVLNAAKVEQAVNSFLRNEKNIDNQRIWFLLMYQMWYDRWMK
jgi:asparagine synthase (glutamine-hydrolysing)